MSARASGILILVVLMLVFAASWYIADDIPRTGQHWSFARQDSIAGQLKTMDNLLTIADRETRKILEKLGEIEKENTKLKDKITSLESRTKRKEAAYWWSQADSSREALKHVFYLVNSGQTQKAEKFILDYILAQAKKEPLEMRMHHEN